MTNVTNCNFEKNSWVSRTSHRSFWMFKFQLLLRPVWQYGDTCTRPRFFCLTSALQYPFPSMIFTSIRCFFQYARSLLSKNTIRLSNRVVCSRVVRYFVAVSIRNPERNYHKYLTLVYGSFTGTFTQNFFLKKKICIILIGVWKT